jgi:hypothetical protein
MARNSGVVRLKIKVLHITKLQNTPILNPMSNADGMDRGNILRHVLKHSKSMLVEHAPAIIYLPSSVCF